MQKSKAQKLRNGGMSYRQMAARLGVSTPTVMRWLGWREKPRTRIYSDTVRGRVMQALRASRSFAKRHGRKPCTDSVEVIVARFTDRCECCLSEKDLCVDHDHLTGKFRGWICQSCNSAIGQLGDNLKGVLNAVRYLKGTV